MMQVPPEVNSVEFYKSGSNSRSLSNRQKSKSTSVKQTSSKGSMSNGSPLRTGNKSIQQKKSNKPEEQSVVM